MQCSILKAARFILLMLFVCLSNANACDENIDPCGKHTEWNEYETATLHVKQDGMPVTNSYYMQSSRSNGDLQVDIDIPDPRSPQKGTILMVEGGTFVSKGIVLSPGREIDALDAPLLSIILAQKVLSRALPYGPAALTGKQRVKHEDKKTGIQFATPSAQGFIPAPWFANGFVKPNSDGSIDFELNLKWPSKNDARTTKTKTATLSGQLKHNAGFQIDSKLPLDGWSVFGVGPIVKKTKSGTIYDYGVRQIEDRPTTIADIRKKIAAGKYPGVRDASKDFTGFWKSKCEDAFGLQIMHYGTDGMYSIVFCGPGGCGNIENARKTFITGDKSFEVVSEDELIEINISGEKERNLRCTKDPHPVLKYKSTAEPA